MVASVSTNPLFTALIDDAAIFPPGNLPLAEAVLAHHAHLRAPYADLVGPFVCADRSLADLTALLDQPIDLTVVVTGGAGAIGPALTHAARSEHVTVRAVEIALRDEDDLARNAQRIATMLDLEMPDGVTAAVEMPRIGDGPPTAGWQSAADEVAATGHRLKFRTGGEWADSHPTESELASFIEATLDRECAFKLTSGLHRAIRHTGVPSGFEIHGFLNVLVATHALLYGGNNADAAHALARRDAEVIAAELKSWNEYTQRSVRRWFTSLGSCSIDEPVTDLHDLELLK